MITPILERAILKGFASYSRASVAFSSFGVIPIPRNRIVIITDIKWYQFINPRPGFEGQNVREFLKYNEWQLKIDGKKSTNYMQYRNNFTWKDMSGGASFVPSLNQAMAAHIGGFDAYFFPEPGDPIQDDVYFIAEEYIKLTITRNAFVNAVTSTFAAVTQSASEAPPPNGIGGVNVTLRSQMTAPNASVMNYTEAAQYSGLTPPASGRNYDTYRQDVTNPDSIVSDFDVPSTLSSYTNFPFRTYPLVELGIVTINSNDFDRLQTT